MDKNKDISFLVSDGREPLPPGTALYERIGDLEHYTLGPLLGAGATGLIYRATRTKREGQALEEQNLTYAIKECYPKPMGSWSIVRQDGVVKGVGPKGRDLLLSMQEQFQAEVQISQEIANMTDAVYFALEKLNVAQVHLPGGQTVRGGTFLLMKEMAPGTISLWDILEECKRPKAAGKPLQTGGLPSFRTTVRIMETLLLAVNRIHKHPSTSGETQYFLHGDLQPANLWFKLTPDGEVDSCWLADFGCARQTDEAGYCSDVKGPLAGTPGFLAPEFYLSDRNRKISQRSDIYAVGKIFWLLLTGTNARVIPSTRDCFQLDEEGMQKIGAPLWQRQDINRILSKALALLEADRYRNAQEMYQEIHNLAAGHRPLNLSLPVIDTDAYQQPAQLETLMGMLNQGNPLILHGFGGLGKTTLAIALGRRIEESTTFGHAYFVRFPESGSIQELITETIAKSCSANVTHGPDGKRLPDRIIFDNVFQVLNTELCANDVLIIDNMDSEQLEWSELCYGTEPDRESFPWIGDIYDNLCALNAHLVITTRITPPAGSGKIVEIDQLSTKQLRAIIRHYYEEPCNDQDLDKLIELVGRHTLTVDLIGRTLKYSAGITLQEMYDLLYDKEFDSAEFAKVSSCHHPKLGKQRINAHLHKLFQVANLPEKERSMLKTALFIGPDGMSLRLFKQICSDFDSDSLNHLQERGWIQSRQVEIIIDPREEELWKLLGRDIAVTDCAERGLSVHPLIREVARKELSPSKEQWEFISSQLDNIVQSNIDNDLRMSSHAISASKTGCFVTALLLDDLDGGEGFLAYVTQPDESLGQPFWGPDRMALDAARKVVFSLEKSLPHVDAKLPGICSSIGLHYEIIGKNERAKIYKEKAVEYQRRSGADAIPMLAVDLISLAYTCRDLGDYPGAIRCGEEALAILEKLYYPQHSMLGCAYSLLCLLYTDLGRTDRYKEHQKKALEAANLPQWTILREKYWVRSAGIALPPGEKRYIFIRDLYRDFSAGYSLLSGLYRSEFHYEEAWSAAKKAEEILSCVFLDSDIFLVNLYAHMSSCAEALEWYPEAKDYLAKAISALEGNQNLDQQEQTLLSEAYFKFTQYLIADEKLEPALDACEKGIACLSLSLDIPWIHLAYGFTSAVLICRDLGDGEKYHAYIRKLAALLFQVYIDEQAMLSCSFDEESFIETIKIIELEDLKFSDLSYLSSRYKRKHPHKGVSRSFYHPHNDPFETFADSIQTGEMIKAICTCLSEEKELLPVLNWLHDWLHEMEPRSYHEGDNTPFSREQWLENLSAAAQGNDRAAEMANLSLGLHYSHFYHMNHALAMKHFQRAEELGGDDMAEVIAAAQYFIGRFEEK